MAAGSRLRAWERHTGPWLTGMALVSLLALVLGSAWPPSRPVTRVVEILAWAVFAADYLARLWLADQRWRFVRRHLIDLAAVALPALRVLRFIAVVARMVTAARRGLPGQVLAVTVLTAATVVVAGAAAVLDAERGAPEASITSYPDALWWAMTTITTVGYGDTYPVTGEGRVIAALLMVVGIAVFGTVAATVAARIIEEDERSSAQPSEALAERLAQLEATVARLADALERR